MVLRTVEAPQASAGFQLLLVTCRCNSRTRNLVFSRLACRFPSSPMTVSGPWLRRQRHRSHPLGLLWLMPTPRQLALWLLALASAQLVVWPLVPMPLLVQPGVHQHLLWTLWGLWVPGHRLQRQLFQCQTKQNHAWSRLLPGEWPRRLS